PPHQALAWILPSSFARLNCYSRQFASILSSKRLSYRLARLYYHFHLVSKADNPRRDTNSDGVFRNILAHHRTCADLSASTNPNARQDCCMNANVTTRLQEDRSKFDLRGSNRKRPRKFTMRRRRYTHARPYTHAIPDHQAARAMQEALLTDPDVASDFHLAFVISAQDCIVADIYIAPNRYVLGMKRQSAVLEDYMLAELPESGLIYDT